MDSNRKIRLSAIFYYICHWRQCQFCITLQTFLAHSFRMPPVFYFINPRTLELPSNQFCCKINIRSASDVKTYLPQLEIKQLCGRRNSLLNIYNLIPRAQWDVSCIRTNHQAGRQILFNSMEKGRKDYPPQEFTF